MNGRRLHADGFEDLAARRVVDGGLDPNSFRAMFGIFRLGVRMFSDLETLVHRPAGWSLAGFRVMFIVWVIGPTESHEIADRKRRNENKDTFSAEAVREHRENSAAGGAI